MEGDQAVGFTHSAVRRRKRDGIKFSLSTLIIFLCEEWAEISKGNHAQFA